MRNNVNKEGTTNNTDSASVSTAPVSARSVPVSSRLDIDTMTHVFMGSTNRKLDINTGSYYEQKSSTDMNMAKVGVTPAKDLSSALKPNMVVFASKLITNLTLFIQIQALLYMIYKLLIFR